MKRRILISLISVLTFMFFTTEILAQTRSRSSTRNTRGGSFRRDRGREEDYRRGEIQDFIAAIIGSQLRSPDPKIRIQAIESIVSGIATTEGTRGGDTTSGARGLFSITTREGGGRDSRSTGVGGAAFIPDLYALLADPDPEVRDIASVGLDVMFGTDVTLMRLMDDPDPIIRKYATKIYTTKAFSYDRDREDEEEYGDVRELLALRTLLVRLKYEKDPGVRKVLIDSIEWYVARGGTEREGRTERVAGIFGVDPKILEYLKDENPEIRKNAVRIIGEMEYSPEMLNLLMERLKVEKDESVKAEIQKAIDKFIVKQKYFEGGRGGIPR